MIKKNEEQFDSGGVMLKHIFLLERRRWSEFRQEDITEDMVDEYMKELTEDFKDNLKFYIMNLLGYEGKDENGLYQKIKAN
jgi:Ser-tRNA(Ala) deacylase AlaX